MDSEDISTQCQAYLPINISMYFATSPGKAFFFSTIFPIVTTIGVLVNFSFFFVIYRIKEMQTVTNFYLGNLAAADVALLVTCGVQYIVTGINSPRFTINYSSRTSASCIITTVLGYGSYFASVFFVTTVMFERYMAICHPLKHRMIRGKGRALKTTVLTWLMSLAMGSFGAFNSNLTTYCAEWLDDTGSIQVDVIPVCDPYPIAYIMNRVLIFMDCVQFIVALVLGGYMMVRIIQTLSNRNVAGGDSKDAAAASIEKARNQVARMLIINAVIFFICLVPFEIYNLDFFYQYFNPDQTYLIQNPTVYLIIGWGGRTTMLLNSTINPILYNMTNSRYRESSKKAFGCGSAPIKKSNIQTVATIKTDVK